MTEQNNIAPEVIDKIQDRILMICMATIIILWGISEIALGISHRQAMEEMELRKQAFEIQSKKTEKKLEEIQKKYKKEIEMEERIKKINVFTLNYEDIEILAINNYYESRGVGRKNWAKKRKDMENITSVVLNRYDSRKYGRTIKQVIQKAKKQKNGQWICQFSWVCDENRPNINKNSKEWKLAYEVAYEIYTGIIPRTVKPKAMHYYNPITSKPTWAKKGKEATYVYGGHKVIIID